MQTPWNKLMVVDYFEAWQMWWSEALTGNHLLYGIEIRTWGRLAKVFELLGAMALIVDIVGVKRINKFGKWIGHIFRKYKIGPAAQKLIYFAFSGLTIFLVAGIILFSPKITAFIARQPDFKNTLRLFAFSGTVGLLVVIAIPASLVMASLILKNRNIGTAARIIGAVFMFVGLHFEVLTM